MPSFYLFFVLNIQTKRLLKSDLKLKYWVLILKIKRLGSVSIFCRWIAKCQLKEKCSLSIWKIDTLPSTIWFLRMPKRYYGMRIINYEFRCSENVKHLQKTMQILRSEVAEARASVWFFNLLIGKFWLVLLLAWCYDSCYRN